MKAQNLIIYSDMDGTMLTDRDRGPYVPQRNLQAIKRFISEGGAFSVASGREYSDILRYFPDIEFNAPLVCGNGSNLYDCQADKVFFADTLSKNYKTESAHYLLTHDNVWMVAADQYSIYQIMTGDPGRDSSIVDYLIRKTKTVDEYINGDMVKTVYVAADASQMEALRKDIDKLPSAHEVAQMLSSPIYCEIVNKTVSKAEGIRRAMKYAGMTDRTLVCIGDYMNDYAMIKNADIPACPSNACEQIRQLCGIVTCDNNTGAVADLIDRLLAM